MSTMSRTRECRLNRVLAKKLDQQHPADPHENHVRLPPLMLLYSENGSRRDLSSIPPLSSFSNRRKTRNTYMEEMRSSKPVASSVLPTPNATKCLFFHICKQVRPRKRSMAIAVCIQRDAVQFDTGTLLDTTESRDWIYVATVSRISKVCFHCPFSRIWLRCLFIEQDDIPPNGFRYMWAVDAFSHHGNMSLEGDNLLTANLSKLRAAIYNQLCNISSRNKTDQSTLLVPIVLDSLLPLLAENSANSVIYFLQSLRQLHAPSGKWQTYGA